MAQQFITIEDVAAEFGLKTRTMREYRRLRIIEPIKRIKGTDQYIRSEVRRAVKIVDRNSFKTLSEIADLVVEDRNKARRAAKDKKKRQGQSA